MEQVKAAPIVRKLAKEDNVDLSQIKGTGNGGFITKADYEAFTGKVSESKPVRNDEPRGALNHATDEVEVGGMSFRRGRQDLDHSTRAKLGINKKHLNPDLEYRWVNDDNGRIDALREMGYEIVTPEALGDETISVQRRVGTKKDGSDMSAHLMATPKKWRQERHQNAEQERKAKEDGMFKAPHDENGKLSSSEFYAKRDQSSGYVNA